jgi:hypothetical protein
MAAPKVDNLGDNPVEENVDSVIAAPKTGMAAPKSGIAAPKTWNGSPKTFWKLMI